MNADAVSRLNAALSGRYVIERHLGEGGMATVYLASDLRHQRKVALKVLRPELAAVVGAERFLAEIRTTANLQHPHILPLFDSGEADGFLFYAMPWVEGESLRERIDREHQLPVNEAVAIATSVAEALDYAHRHGVIHRDIKPANILLQDGKPVLSDFGIALAVGVAGGGRLTETGLSLGTPHYMSPEQATGDQAVHAATDIYALGCVLYEMLVGDPPYTGSTAQAVLGKIIQGEPVSVTKSRRSVPPHVDAVIRRSIEKVAADRFATAREFGAALANPSFRHGEAEAAAQARTSVWKPLALATSASTIALAGVLAWGLMRPSTPLPVERYETPFRAGQEPVQLFNPGGFRLSPDGSMLVYLGPVPDGAGTQLWVRRWDDPEAVPVRGTLGATEAAVSPDGRELAFVQTSELKILALEGGPIRVLAGDVLSVLRWHADDYISFTTTDGDAVRVPAAGGPVESVSARRDGEARRFLLQILPGGDRALLGIQFLNQEYELHAHDLGTGESVRLISAIVAHYTDTGHLVFSSDGSLLAAPFDARAMELTGPPVALVDGVRSYSLSTNGRLAYSGGAAQDIRDTELVWVTRSGNATPVEGGWIFDRGDANPGWSLSPDGTRLALRLTSSDGNQDIWIKDLPSGPLRRLTFAEDEQRVPFWTPDGTRVTYFSTSAGIGGDVWWSRADGTGQPELILAAMRGFTQGTWSPDASSLVLRTAALVLPGQSLARDLLRFRPTADTAAIPLVATAEYAEADPALSHDGHWISYTSDETGRPEVFVRPFPDVDAAKVQVSTEGGSGPIWSRDGRELFYVDGARNLVAVRFDVTNGFRVTSQDRLFEIPIGYIGGVGINTLDVAPDGERFLMGRAVAAADGAPEGPRLVLVHNFFEELRRRVPR